MTPDERPSPAGYDLDFGPSSSVDEPMSPWTLSFQSGPVEQEYTRDLSERVVAHLRFAYLLAIILYLTFAWLDRALAPSDYLGLWRIRFGLGMPALVLAFGSTFVPPLRIYFQPIAVVALFLAGAGIVEMTAIAPPHVASIYYVGLILVMIYVYAFVRLRFVLATLVGMAIIAHYEYTALNRLVLDDYVLLANNLFLLSASAIGLAASYQLETFQRRGFLRARALRVESEKAERLLMNLLPTSVARRLIDREIPIADGYSEVTILFADIVGFTEMSSRMLPRDTVRMLNDFFLECDSLADKYGIEKIKTVGDAYMAVSGLPDYRDDHAEAMADMALEMVGRLGGFNEERHLNLEVRVGINTGPVVAGVIGRKRFLFDVWGDAVNVASRLEAHGIRNGIQVSEHTYYRLRPHFELEARGQVEIAGRAPMETYVLLGRRPA